MFTRQNPVKNSVGVGLGWAGLDNKSLKNGNSKGLRGFLRKPLEVQEAEEVGFEPTVVLPTTVFKTAALNRTRPLLQKNTAKRHPFQKKE